MTEQPVTRSSGVQKLLPLLKKIATAVEFCANEMEYFILM